MTATQEAQDVSDWRERGWQRDREHHDHGGCVAEADIMFPVEFLPDGRWHVGQSVLDAGPLALVDDTASPAVLCGWDENCGEVVTRASAVDMPSGPELAVMLLRAFAQRGREWDYFTPPVVRRLRGLLDLARAMPDSLLTREVRALFGDLDDAEASKPVPVALSQLWAVKAHTPGVTKPDQAGEADGPASVTPPEITEGSWIMAPDYSDPFGMRTIPREVRRAYAEEQQGTVGRWVIEFAGDYLYPTSLVTAVDHTYKATTAHTPDRTALAVRYLAPDGENITDQPAPHHDAALIHISDRSGQTLAALDLDPVHTDRRTWRLVPGFADVPAHWFAQRWIDADAAIFWVWDQIQALIS